MGQTGVTLTRLAPMGRVRIGEVTAEAKVVDDFIDPKQVVEVIGFDNTVVIVARTHKHNEIETTVK